MDSPQVDPPGVVRHASHPNFSGPAREWEHLPAASPRPTETARNPIVWSWMVESEDDVFHLGLPHTSYINMYRVYGLRGCLISLHFSPALESHPARTKPPSQAYFPGLPGFPIKAHTSQDLPSDLFGVPACDPRP